MQKKRKDNQFIKQAYYQGGNTAFRKFVAEQLKYPEEALENDIEGIVHLKIDIDHKGKVIGVKVMQGIGHGCDKEAMRIIRKAEYEVPANPKKMRVIFHKNVRIQFKKPKVEKEVEKKAPQVNKKTSTLSLEYEISTNKKKESTASDRVKKTSYNYTINF